MFDKDMAWPRLALYEENNPPMGFYQDFGGEIQVVLCGKEPIYTATISSGELANFCKIFGLDTPDATLCDHVDGKFAYYYDTLELKACDRCGYDAG